MWKFIYECLKPSLGSNTIEYPVQSKKARSKKFSFFNFLQCGDLWTWQACCMVKNRKELKENMMKTYLLCFGVFQSYSHSFFPIFSFSSSWIRSCSLPPSQFFRMSAKPCRAMLAPKPGLIRKTSSQASFKIHVVAMDRAWRRTFAWVRDGTSCCAEMCEV